VRLRPSRPRGRLLTGGFLVSASFLTYPTYAVVPFLPVSDRVKVAVTLAATLLVWGAFGAGSLPGGRQATAGSAPSPPERRAGPLTAPVGR
jgi:hypothetical protein